MKTIILAFNIADSLNQTSEVLIEEIKTQLGFKLDMSQVEIKEIDMESLTGEELALIESEPTPSESIFAILTALANSNESISLSKRKDPTKALEVANKLIAANNWDEPREGWEKHIEFPQLNEDIDLRKKELVNTLFRKPKTEVTTAPVVTSSGITEEGTNEIPAPDANGDGKNAPETEKEEKDPFAG